MYLFLIFLIHCTQLKFSKKFLMAIRLGQKRMKTPRRPVVFMIIPRSIQHGIRGVFMFCPRGIPRKGFQRIPWNINLGLLLCRSANSLVGDGTTRDGPEEISTHVRRGDELNEGVPTANQVKLNTRNNNISIAHVSSKNSHPCLVKTGL